MLLRGVALTLVALAVIGFLGGPDDRVDAPLGLTVALAIGALPTGIFLVRGLPRHRVARLVLAIGLVAALHVAATAWSGWAPAAWVTQWAWWPAVTLIPLALTYFPDGELPSRRWRALPVVEAVCVAVGSVALAVAAIWNPRGLLTSAESGTIVEHVLVRITILVAGVLVLATLAVLVSLLVRLRGAETLTRRQLACLLPAAGLLVVGIVLDAVGVPGATVPAALALPIGIGVAVLRFQLGDLDLIVNRTVVWLTMSVLVLAAFAVAVALIGSRLEEGGTLVATALATGLVAAGFDPVRRRVQRAVDRMLFGERDAPHLVLSQLGQRMQRAGDAGAMLDELVVALCESLQVPYARMLVDTEEGVVSTAEHGRPQPQLVDFPMTAHGEPVGVLQVAPRRVGEDFTTAERALLEDVASQAGIAAQAHRLTLALLRSREGLVLAREEERLRLRRELHDGLGPALVGIRMQVMAARNGGGGEQQELLGRAVEDLSDSSAEVRRLVDGLRPPALDQGLGEALRQRADALLTGMASEIAIDPDLGELPAAVEVAVYRIATEAISNVVRHAEASRCEVTLTRDARGVHLSVADDGTGAVAARDGGVGLDSMRLRAAELGGRLEVTGGADGTRVEAWIPLRRG